MPGTSIEFQPVVSAAWLAAILAAMVVAFVLVRVWSGPASQLARRWPIYSLRALLLLVLVTLTGNPVRITNQDGAIQPATAFFLLDASQSMAIGNQNETRWDRAREMIGKAAELASDDALAEVSLFRFGRRLSAIESSASLELNSASRGSGQGVTFASKNNDGTSRSSDDAIAGALTADEPDTQMLVALRQLSSRFGRRPPDAVVVFSDGRARDAARLEEVARYFAQLDIPIHTVPFGGTQSAGDVAFVSLVMPTEVRKHSEVRAQAFLRSYGYDGQQVELHINAIEADGSFVKRMTTHPVTLQSGFQPVSLTFHTDNEPRRLEAVVTQLPGETSTDNNRLETEVSLPGEKIRVLYFEGGTTFPDGTVGNPEFKLRRALTADRDIQVFTVPVRGERAEATATDQPLVRPFSVTELAAFDAIVLSNVGPQIFTAEQLRWIQSWVQRRGGGICMTGGPNSFGPWRETPVAEMLPVIISNEDDWDESFRSVMLTDTRGTMHPVFRILGDTGQNRELLSNFPRCLGANVNLLPKSSGAQVLAIAQPNLPSAGPDGNDGLSTEFPDDMKQWLAEQTSKAASDRSEFAGITIGRSGEGRTMAIALPITSPGSREFVLWGPGDGSNSHYGKFWRRTIYWLTERSFVGRRRLVARTDKQYYEPGDTITLTAQAFNKTAAETSDYRLVAMIEPQTFDNLESDYSTIRWPSNIPRKEVEEVPFAMWGEEIGLTVREEDGRVFYDLELPIADALPKGMTNQSMRIELVAWQGTALVDSTSLPIQILHDPFEQQNPLPNHNLLTELSALSGGTVINSDQELAEMLSSLPIRRGPNVVSTTPLWNTWWVLTIVLALASAEWSYRRWSGLA